MDKRKDWEEMESYVDMLSESAINDVLDTLRNNPPAAREMLEEVIEKAWRALQDTERARSDAAVDAAVDPANPYRKVPPAEVHRAMLEWEKQRAAA